MAKRHRRARPRQVVHGEVVRYNLDEYLRQRVAAIESGFAFAQEPSYATVRGHPVERAEDYASLASYAYRGDSVVAACMRVRRDLFRQARFCWRTLSDSGPGRVFRTPELRLLERPWPNGTTGELLARMVTDVDLCGNSFIANEGDRLRWLRPDWVSIVLSGDPAEDPFIDVLGYIYTPGGQDPERGVPYLPEQICHWSPEQDPMAQYRGMSWVSKALEDVTGDRAATTHKLAFFRNGATLGPIVRVPAGMTLQQFKDFVAAAEAAHAGASNAYRTMYVGGGAEVTLAAADFKQLDLKAVQGGYETRIAAVAGVHPTLVGLSEGMQGSSLNAGNFTAARRLTAEMTLFALWQDACGALQAFFDPADDTELWIREKDIPFLREERKDQAEITNSKVLTLEAGIRAGYKPDALVDAVEADDITLLKGQHTGLTSVQLLPPGAQDTDGDGRPDQDGAAADAYEAELEAARAELLIERARYGAGAGERIPVGHEGGGRFRKLSDRITAALKAWLDGDGDDDPLESYSREQLRKAAKDLGITPRRGASAEEIKLALLKHARRGFDRPQAPNAKEQGARDRQDRIDKVRGKAESVAEALELVDAEASERALKHRINAMHTRGKVDEKTRDRMLQGVDDGNLPDVAKEIAGENGLTLTADAGAVVAWKPATGLLRPGGGGFRDGQFVSVIRPGVRYDPGDGEVLIAQGVADEADEKEIAEAKAPAKAATKAGTPERAKEDKALIREYVKGASISELAESSGRSPSAIHTMLTKNGVQLRPRGAPSRRTTSRKAVAAAEVPPPRDGLDDLDDRDLRDLAVEFDISAENHDRAALVAGLRKAGAVSPDVGRRRAQARTDLDGRLAGMGRRVPADASPLDRAAVALANGEDPKLVAKALRADTAGASSEDAETLRLLASDLTRKKAVIPAYINDRGNVDLRKLAEMNDIDLKRWVPQEKKPFSGLAWLTYRDENPFDHTFRYFTETLADPEPNDPRAKIVKRMRESAARMREVRTEILKGRHPINHNPARHKEIEPYTSGALAAAKDMERLADLVEQAKVPPKKRAKSLGGTVLGEVVPVDESRFVSRPLKGGLLQHRGEAVPDGLRHKGSGTSLVLDQNVQQRPGLTPGENRALDLYTVGAVADGLNGSLRKGRNTHGSVSVAAVGPVDLDQVQLDLDSAIGGSQLTADSVLWRGAIPTNSDYRRLVPGAIYTDVGYMSTSTDERGARQTIDWRKRNGTVPSGRKPVMFKILAPAGTNAALGHERVSEALLPRGQEFRVVRLDESGDVPVVVMEVIPRVEEPGLVRARSVVDEFDYEATAKRPPHKSGSLHQADLWLGDIQKAQGYDGPPLVVSAQRMDEIVAGGGMELFRGVREADGKSPATLVEEYRSGKLFPGTGVYGSGTYSAPERGLALGYGGGNEAGLLRIVLRRDARVIQYGELLKLRPQARGNAAKLAEQRQAELAAVDPNDTAAVAAIIEKYERLMARQGPKSRVMADMGRLAALLGYDAIIKPAEYRGPGSKNDGQTEVVILNRTATYVEEAMT